VSCCASCELTAELRRVGRSPLFADGGYRIYAGLFGDGALSGLLHEALAGKPEHHLVPAGASAERGGTPARQLSSVNGGPRQRALFQSPELGQFLANEARTPVRPCGALGSYSFYAKRGAHLDIHRDVPGCDLALITCLFDNQPSRAGATLELWPEDLTTPLERLRAAPNRAGVRAPLRPGQSILLHGGVLPHRIPPLEAGRVRVVSLLCFELVQ
jgi:hypothetical protein